MTDWDKVKTRYSIDSAYNVEKYGKSPVARVDRSDFDSLLAEYKIIKRAMELQVIATVQSEADIDNWISEARKELEKQDKVESAAAVIGYVSFSPSEAFEEGYTKV